MADDPITVGRGQRDQAGPQSGKKSNNPKVRLLGSEPSARMVQTPMRPLGDCRLKAIVVPSGEKVGAKSNVGPEVSASPSGVVWMSQSGDLSVNARRLVEAFDGTVLLGDMLTLFNRLLGTPLHLAERLRALDLAAAVRGRFTRDSRLAWAARLLNQMGYVNGALHMPRSFGSRGSLAAALRQEHAQALMSGARYYRAAKMWGELAGNGPVGPVELGFWLQAADCWRSYGRWLHSIRMIVAARRKARRLHDVHLVAVADYKAMDHFTRLAELLALLRIPSIVRPPGRWLRRFVERAEDGFLDSGDWMGVRVVAMLQLRLRAREWLPPSTRSPGIGPLEGFDHMAFALGQVMTIRALVRTGLVQSDPSELLRRALQAEQMGLISEAWKLRRLAGQPWSSYPVQRVFQRCEYLPWLRLMWRLGLATSPIGRQAGTSNHITRHLIILSTFFDLISRQPIAVRTADEPSILVGPVERQDCVAQVTPRRRPLESRAPYQPRRRRRG